MRWMLALALLTLTACEGADQFVTDPVPEAPRAWRDPHVPGRLRS
jgi:hypothetical protein